MDHHWSTCHEPRLRDHALVRHNQDIRCFTGDGLNYICGLYNGNIEVWSANLSPSLSMDCNNKSPNRRLSRSDSNSGYVAKYKFDSCKCNFHCSTVKQ